MVKDIRITDYNYPLPDERIALHPLADRDSCRLLAVSGAGEVSHHIFRDILTLLDDDALLVANNTKVINARLEFFRASGARIEIFLLEPVAPADYQLAFAARGSCVWSALVGNNKKWKEAEISKTVSLSDGRTLTLTARREPGEAASDNSRHVRLSWTPAEMSFAEVVEAAGYIPIPPYLNRDAEAADADDYQTVYSRFDGSVAAPTAGLHFTPALLDALDRKGVGRQYVTLHVGAGTFRPVKSETIGGHPMHTETFRVTLPLLDSLIAALEERREIAAVGTTTVRTLESLPYLALSLRESGSAHVSQWQAYSDREIEPLTLLRELRARVAATDDKAIDASTAIMIAPGFSWKIVSTLITNFHQPQSTLLLLVDSFLRYNYGAAVVPTAEEKEEKRVSLWRRVYAEALDRGYRFLSYGDACLFKSPHS